jgi:hypothetical protein
LLVTLIGVTLLFAIAEVNGTLERLTARAVRACRGHAGALPVMFFVVGFAVSTIGAGATPASALLAPARHGRRRPRRHPAAADGDHGGERRACWNAVAVCADRIVAHGVMARIGLGGVVGRTFVYNALAHAFVGIAGFLLLGGWRLFGRGRGAGVGRRARAGRSSVPTGSRRRVSACSSPASPASASTPG